MLRLTISLEIGCWGVQGILWHIPNLNRRFFVGGWGGRLPSNPTARKGGPFLSWDSGAFGHGTLAHLGSAALQGRRSLNPDLWVFGPFQVNPTVRAPRHFFPWPPRSGRMSSCFVCFFVELSLHSLRLTWKLPEGLCKWSWELPC